MKGLEEDEKLSQKLNTIWLEIRDSRFRIQDSKFKIQKETYKNAISKEETHFRKSKYVPIVVLL